MSYNKIIFDYSIKEDLKVRVELTDIKNDGMYFSPCAHSVKINDVKIDGDYNIEITNEYARYYEEEDDYDTEMSVLKNSISLGGSGLINYINQYFEKSGNDYRIDSNDHLNSIIKGCYSTNNKVTIRYDI